MSNIKITVNEQNLYITDAPKIAAQGVNENYVVFSFSSDWSGFGKTAVFYAEEDPETVYTSIVDAAGSALIPWEVTNDKRKICIGVSGVKDDVVKTSEILKYKIVNGLYVAESSPPSPGIYEQMVTLAGAITDQLNNTPYLEYEEDDDFTLPIHTINDEEISNDSTWSSTKINEIKEDVEDLTSATVYQELTESARGLTFKFYKFGRFVLLKVTGTTSGSISTSGVYTAVISDLAEAFRPASNSAAQVFFNTDKTGKLRVTTDGNVQFGMVSYLGGYDTISMAADISSNEELTMQMMYIAAA